jgi:hypothetical protein
MGEPQPRMRAGDKDRQHVVEQLGRHFAEGRLTVDEFDERAVRAHATVYLDEFPVLTADLPGDPVQHTQLHREPTRSPRQVPGLLVLLIAMLLAWSLVATVVYSVPPLFGLFVLFLFVRHMRWSRHWR